VNDSPLDPQQGINTETPPAFTCRIWKKEQGQRQFAFAGKTDNRLSANRSYPLFHERRGLW